jgi:hypothetical protein
MYVSFVLFNQLVFDTFSLVSECWFTFVCVRLITFIIRVFRDISRLSFNRVQFVSIRFQFVFESCSIPVQFMFESCSVRFQFVFNSFSIRLQFVFNSFAIRSQFVCNSFAIRLHAPLNRVGFAFNCFVLIHFQYEYSIVVVHVRFVNYYKCIRLLIHTISVLDVLFVQ